MGFLVQEMRSRMVVTATSTQPTLELVVEDCCEQACQETEHVPLRFYSRDLTFNHWARNRNCSALQTAKKAQRNRLGT
jgi:hypothetical protein